MAQKCLDCGEVMHGRADKKFCSDLCRNSYNNRQNSDRTNFMRNINNILRRNRRLLQQFHSGEKTTTVHRDKLSEKGFHFGYHTHTLTTRKSDTYIFCYDMGYLPVSNNFIMIVRQKGQTTAEETA